MSDTQDDTDPQPTPGPWEIDQNPSGSRIGVKEEGKLIDWVATVQVSNTPNYRANARLIAAAGTAAHEAAEMGYDGQAAVEALPNGLDAARRAILDLQDAHTDGPPEDTAEAAAQAAAHRLKVFMAEAGADESMIPGDASVALESAGGHQR